MADGMENFSLISQSLDAMRQMVAPTPKLFVEQAEPEEVENKKLSLGEILTMNIFDLWDIVTGKEVGETTSKIGLNAVLLIIALIALYLALKPAIDSGIQKIGSVAK